MKAYKGFNKDMTCRGFAYKEGETYETDRAELCETGFHACENPLDVFVYYPPCDENGNLNKFHEVELDGVSDRRDNDTKVVAKKIKIGAEINFFGLAKAHVEWVKRNLDGSKKKVNSGDSSSAVNSGDSSSAVNSGDSSSAVNSGDRSSAVNSGYSSSAVNSGYRSSAVNSGDSSSAVNSGYRSSAVNSGKDGIAVAWGVAGKAKAARGSYIALAEWAYDAGKCEYVLKCAKMHKVDGKTVKPDTFYTLENGHFVEVKE